ncbi:phage holin family protein [Pseudoponticoccus marisrubri]|uniref:Phage holin family protein n=1 Tax=Pseudoponticoccus marisrubri TaxID=1685382 RepID=A0A0W7WJ91_9RHOB|nr:phage holin family protein [Pseudoponticoccus marisrubri]KUF10582.1 hypothetical protein AVJ23_11935 [Pseudoponticoccus marisrubri]
MTQPDPDPTLRDAPDILGEAMTHVTGLIRAEAALARSEIAAGLTKMRHGAVLIAVAALVGLAAVHALAAALALALIALGLPPLAATALVALLLVAACAGLALMGRKRLNTDALVPEQALRNIEKDIRSAREMTHG